MLSQNNFGARLRSSDFIYLYGTALSITNANYVDTTIYLLPTNKLIILVAGLLFSHTRNTIMAPSSLVVVSFNTESGGRPHFDDYVKTLVTEKSPDVIAFQEVHHATKTSAPRFFMPKDPGKRKHPIRLHLFAELKKLLGEDYKAYYTPHLVGVHDLEPCDYDGRYGQALFVHTRCVVRFFWSDFIFGSYNQFNTEYQNGKPAGKAALGVSLLIPSGQQVILSNIHGFWSRLGKVDMPERFVQNEGINHHLKRIKSAVANDSFVICVGDLNYRSDLQALEDLRLQPMFGAYGGVVLNHTFGVACTRTSHYDKVALEPEADFMIACQKLADHAVYLKTDFDAPSDHSPLTARFVFP